MWNIFHNIADFILIRRNLPMNPIIDLHTHTIASGHAYNTLKENLEEAMRQGLKVLGTSEHAPMMPGTAPLMYFMNFKVIPREISGVRLYNGIEANILDTNGTLDVNPELASKLDYIIASMHDCCYENQGISVNTKTLLKVMENPEVNIIGHPDDARFPIDYDEIAASAAEHKKALELNDASLNPTTARRGAHETMPVMLACCRKYGTKILMGTDSHICWEVGDFRRSMKLLSDMNFPEDLIINFDLNKLSYVLKKH